MQQVARAACASEQPTDLCVLQYIDALNPARTPLVCKTGYTA